jgi:competence protein ComEC
MSAVATAGILLWLGGWQRTMSTWAPDWLAGAICLPLAAQLATQPLVTALNGQVSAVGPFANLAAGPFVGPVTMLGLAACLVSTVSAPAATALGWLAGWCAEPILLVAHAGAGLPGATIPVGASGPILVAVGAISLIAAWGVRRMLASAWATAAVCAVLVVGVLVPMPTPGWPGQWTVVFCDVGQGNAAVVNVGPGAGLLVDAGPDPPSLYRCLDALGIRRLPLVVLTHQHADHIGGADNLADRYQVGEVMVRAGLSDDKVAGVRELVDDPDVPVVRADAGERLAIGAAEWTTLSSGPVFELEETGEGEDPEENNASTIGVLELNGLRVLFTGDAEPEEQEDVVATHQDLVVDVLSVPHHGSARQAAEFIADTHAPVAVVSVGANNSYGHPAPRTMTLLQDDDMRVWRTDQRGSIAVAKANGVVRVTAQRAAP